MSRIEGGRTIINDLSKPVRWSIALRIPDHALWFALPDDCEALANSVAFCQPRVAPIEKYVVASENREFLWVSTLKPTRGDAVHRDGRPVSSASSTRIVGLGGVDVVRETNRAFRQIGNHFGGGRIRSAVGAYLATEVAPALTEGKFSISSRRSFQRASVELHQLAGWMAHDVGDDRAGKHHLQRVLGIASEVGDDALTAEMLAAMSHQAAFSRRSDETIDLALAARRQCLLPHAGHGTVRALRAEMAALGVSTD